MAKITEMFKQMMIIQKANKEIDEQRLIAQNALNEMAKLALEEKNNVSKRSNKHYQDNK